MSSFDETVDYYQVLGLRSDAPVEDLKYAYLQLAKEKHPDTADATKNVKDANAEFNKIATAWGILSKPELKSQYDFARKRHLASLGFVSGVASVDRTFGNQIPTNVIGDTFSAQQANYATISRVHSDDNWGAMQASYKNSRWHNMTLDEKKSIRIRPINASKNVFGAVVMAVVFMGGFGIYLNNRMIRKYHHGPPAGSYGSRK